MLFTIPSTAGGWPVEDFNGREVTVEVVREWMRIAVKISDRSSENLLPGARPNRESERIDDRFEPSPGFWEGIEALKVHENAVIPGLSLELVSWDPNF